MSPHWDDDPWAEQEAAKSGKRPKELATAKQKEFARDLGIDFPPDISKSAISRRIDRAIAKRDQERATWRVEKGIAEPERGGCLSVVVFGFVSAAYFAAMMLK